MSKYFKKITSYEALKEQYKSLLKENHPDNGGDLSKMQEINAEYDVLFKIWKDRKENESGEKIKETAASTKRRFYSENGWEGSRYDSKLSLKEIAARVRLYVKEKYPTYKFSVRTSYASMCQELRVSLKESPLEIYKTFEELTEEELYKVWSRAVTNHYVEEFSCLDDLHKELLKDAYNQHNFIKVYTEIVATLLKDVDAFVNTFNYDDSDLMTDYFDVNFYYFNCKPEDVKIVPKTARIKDKSAVSVKRKTVDDLQKSIA